MIGNGNRNIPSSGPSRTGATMISIGTTFNYDIPLKDQLPMIREAGFTHVSLGGGRIEHSGFLNRARRKTIKTMTGGSGLGICSIHAPFHNKADISSPRAVVTAGALSLFKGCIDAALFLEAGMVIFHPTGFPKIDRAAVRKEILVESVTALLDYIGDAGLRLAVENLDYEVSNEILGHSLETVTDPRYGFCYDSSHDNLLSGSMAILERHGDRLISVHISDNRGKEDDHMLPYEGTFDWDGFCRVFSTLTLDGIFLLEVEMRESAIKSPREFLIEAFLRGKKLLQRSGKWVETRGQENVDW